MPESLASVVLLLRYEGFCRAAVHVLVCTRRAFGAVLNARDSTWEEAGIADFKFFAVDLDRYSVNNVALHRVP